jgi:hypothetical protein
VNPTRVVDRIQEPYVTPERWDRELKDAGFSGTDVAIFDSELPCNINVNIISRLKRTVRSHSRISLLHRQDQFVPFVVNVLEILHGEGFQVDLRTRTSFLFWKSSYHSLTFLPSQI